jgi:hypothetical protein
VWQYQWHILASNFIFHTRIKHIEINYHYIREKIINKELGVQFISTTDQVADAFIKGLSASWLQFLQDKLWIRLVMLCLRGYDNITLKQTMNLSQDIWRDWLAVNINFYHHIWRAINSCNICFLIFLIFDCNVSYLTQESIII